MSTEREALIFWLLTNYEVDQLTDEVFKLTLAIGEDRGQLVFVVVWEDNFTVYSPIAEYSPQVASKLLEFISENGVVGVTLVNGMVCITNSVFSLNGPDLDDWISYIGATADRYEKSLTGGGDIL
jgi:hypothetical protein